MSYSMINIIVYSGKRQGRRTWERAGQCKQEYRQVQCGSHCWGYTVTWHTFLRLSRLLCFSEALPLCKLCLYTFIWKQLPLVHANIAMLLFCVVMGFSLPPYNYI